MDLLNVMTTKMRKAGFGSAALALCLALTPLANAAESMPFEYKLKAVFLLNFAKFIVWPGSAFASDTAPLTICVVGEDPFGSALDQVLNGETVQNHKLKVLRPGTDTANPECHIAFFSQATEAQAEALLAKYQGQYTLTVGEQDKFLRQGGMINFAVEESKVKFIINTTPLSRARFEISSKLLSLGRAEQY